MVYALYRHPKRFCIHNFSLLLTFGSNNIRVKVNNNNTNNIYSETEEKRFLINVTFRRYRDKIIIIYVINGSAKIFVITAAGIKYIYKLYVYTFFINIARLIIFQYYLFMFNDGKRVREIMI